MENLEPKNEYFEKKERKEAEAKKQSAHKLVKKTLIWFLVLVGLALVIWWGWRAAITRTVLPGEFFKEQSREHIPVGSQHPEYRSNPPTSGWHYDRPAQTGIYDKELLDEQLIHNLEHSHIWIAYKPDLSKDQIEKLAEIAKDYGSRVIMAPRAKNDSPIALAAWQYLLKLDVVDEKRVRNFVNTHRNIAGPERNIPDSGFKDFREGN